jgi:hypothetical protein
VSRRGTVVHSGTNVMVRGRRGIVVRTVVWIRIELEGFWSSVARVWDLVHGGPTGMSSLEALLSSIVELIEDYVNAVTGNGVRWGTRSTLAAAMSHFLEMGAELEPLGSEHNKDLKEDQADALWTQTCQASKSMVAFIPLSVACGSPNDMGEE